MRGLDTGFTGGWVSLDVSYRLPKTFLPYVRDYAERYLPEELLNLPNPIQDANLVFPSIFCNMKWVQVTKKYNDVSRICANEIIDLLRRYSDKGISVADLVFLSQRITDGKEIIDLLNDEYGYCFRHTFVADKEEGRRLKHAFFLGDARIKATTIHSFKGYEARAIVVYIDESDIQPVNELLYVALTRLRDDESGSYITVVCSDDKLADYGKTWPEYIEDLSEYV
jgi:hypothetical protein